MTQNEEDKPKRQYLPDGTWLEILPPAEKPDITVEDVQARHLERVARGYFLGNTQWNKNKAIKEKLEERVVKKVGSKGKFIVDKLFELINGVYIVEDEKINPKTGKIERIKSYREKPDLKAIMYALDRVLGRPTERVESFDENEGIRSIATILKSLATIKRKDDKRPIVTVEGKVVEHTPAEQG